MNVLLFCPVACNIVNSTALFEGSLAMFTCLSGNSIFKMTESMSVGGMIIAREDGNIWRKICFSAILST
jgi:hypothetical protein